MWTAAHILGYTALTYGALTACGRVLDRRRRKSHANVMRRILQLETSTGSGIAWAREWLEGQKPRTAGIYSRNDIARFPCSVRLVCLGCGEEFTGVGDTELGDRLCFSCLRALRD